MCASASHSRGKQHIWRGSRDLCLNHIIWWMRGKIGRIPLLAPMYTGGAAARFSIKLSSSSNDNVFISINFVRYLEETDELSAEYGVIVFPRAESGLFTAALQLLF